MWLLSLFTISTLSENEKGKCEYITIGLWNGSIWNFEEYHEICPVERQEIQTLLNTKQDHAMVEISIKFGFLDIDKHVQ